MKLITSAMVAFIIFCAAFIVAQEVPEVPAEEENRETLNRAVERLEALTGEPGRKLLANMVDGYPFRGIGIKFQLEVQATATDQHELYAPRILSVYRDSPAYAAGLKPGDWLIALDDKSFGTIADASDIESGAFLNGITERIRKVRDPFMLAVERDGKRLEVGLTKAVVGQEIHDFATEHMPEYLERLDDLRIWVKSFTLRVQEAEGFRAELLLDEGLALSNEAHKPFEELDAYIRTRTIQEPE